MLQKGVYAHEWIDGWEKCSEKSLPEKEDFYHHLNLEHITDADYMHGKRVFKGFEIEHLGEYYDLYIQSDTLLLEDEFENFRNIVLKYMIFTLFVFLLKQD